MVSLTTEEFKQLLESVGRSNTRIGSFSNCTARFDGERNPSKVEEFISAITTFKVVENINDENAVSSMPMLLEGDASEWWRGVKTSSFRFSDVITMLREAFSPPKPAWRVYAEINEARQQMNEPTDSFIRKKRALFSRLR
ncbi:activity-regulated cytoskeleton associated protein 2-like [Haematobia irritans]|uniref:activity-regulated cytoskeleton associated protein 2-like n=1 Tax=Haematobia irritans TaxID=7368 RepID=UPI003F5031E5